MLVAVRLMVSSVPSLVSKNTKLLGGTGCFSMESSHFATRHTCSLTQAIQAARPFTGVSKLTGQNGIELCTSIMVPTMGQLFFCHTKPSAPAARLHPAPPKPREGAGFVASTVLLHGYTRRIPNTKSAEAGRCGSVRHFRAPQVNTKHELGLLL